MCTRVCMNTHTHTKYMIYTQLAAQINTESSVFTGTPINTCNSHTDMNSVNN